MQHQRLPGIVRFPYMLPKKLKLIGAKAKIILEFFLVKTKRYV